MKTLPSFFLALALALTGVLVGHSSAHAQQPSLRDVTSTVASCWTGRDANGIAELLSRAGVALHLFDESHPAAGVRQARAALSELFERGGSARITRVEELGGSPQRGYAELTWEAQSQRYVVFVGFVREGDGWRIAEIRVLR
jgi:hypothetical protein